MVCSRGGSPGFGDAGMRAGPDLVAASSVAVGARLSVTRGRVVLATDVPARDVTLDVTAARVVPGKLSFSAPLGMVPTHPLDVLANFGQRVHVDSVLVVDGVRHTVDLGWWQIDTWSEESDHVKVECLDLMQILEEDPLVWPSSPAKGATLRSELQRLAGSLPVVLDDGVADGAVSPLIEVGTSRTEAVRDLCESRGVGYGVKADGCLHVWPLRDGRAPVLSYTGRDLLVGAPRKAQERRPNRWTVVGSNGPGEEEVRWSASVTSEAEPFDPAAYGRVTDRREFQAADSQGAVRKAADTYMRTALSAVGSRSVEVVADPRVELGDVVSVVTDPGEVIVGRVKAYSLPVDDPAGKMRIDLEELLW